MSRPSLPRMLAHRIAVIVAPLALLAACRAPAPSAEPPDAADAASARRPRTDLAASLAADLAAVRHPADGGGRAWLEAATPAVVGAPGTWTIRYQAGPLGVDVGGTVFLQVSPFWGWATPQTERPEAPGYTEVTTAAAGLELEAQTLDEQLLGIRVGGRRMAAGEELRIVYGAGPAGARADRFAEGDSRFWIAVDGDGDGVRKVLADSPGVAVAAGPPALLVVTLPSTARPGEPVRVTVAVLDAAGNAGVPFAGEVRFAGTLDDVPLSAESLLPAVRLVAADAGRKTVSWTPPGEGVVRLEARAEGLAGAGNPLQVAATAGRILWGDLHNHSAFSDGSATPEEQFLYARDVAALDVYALTDHDHWGMLFLDQHPEMWRRIRELTRRFYEPGRFVTLLGFEWTNWIYGHRHVLYFDDAGDVASSVDPATDEPRELWASLAGRKALTIAHHTAGGPIATDWTIAPDPRFEPVTEIVSVHGSSEALDSPAVVHQPVPGNFVRDALGRGYRLGFLGSSDSHDGHPGLAHLASPSSGLAAILAEEATRDAVYDALMARHVYATNGPRIVLRVAFGGHRVGDEVKLGAAGPIPGIPADTLVVQAIAPGEIERVDVVRDGRVEGYLCEGRRRCTLAVALSDLRAGEYLYVRVVQKDGGAAWTSPFYFVD